jgi:hypothetical protein
MSATDLKTYAEITEIAFKIAAMIVVGFWGIYGLIVFRQRQAAITALRKAESEAASLELNAKRRAVLDIAIHHECMRDLEGDGYILSVQVVITNAGVAPAHMVFEENTPPIRLRKVHFDASGVMSLPDPPLPLPIPNVVDPTRAARARVVRAGGTSRLSSVIRVPRSGVYAVSFRAPMDAANAEAMFEAGADRSRRQYWSATGFACVGLARVGASERAPTLTPA